jgi:lysozyme family protein
MKSNYEVCFPHILKEEGGFVNHPRDPGGMTNLGVTKAVYEAYVGHPVDEQTMRSLTPEIVKPLYKARYWDVCKCDDLPSGVDYAVMDLAVNSGPARAVKFLQEVVGAKVDGVLGPMTLDTVNKQMPTTTVLALCDRRRDFVRSLGTYDAFGNGWEKRISRVENIAHGMASD